MSSKSKISLPWLGILALNAGCASSVLCEPGGYLDVDHCVVANYNVLATCQSPRIDIRQPGTIAIHIEVQRNSESALRKLADGATQQISLQPDGTAPVPIAAVTMPDQRGVTVTPGPGLLTVGPLSATVTLDPTLTGVASGCRVFRSPSYGTPENVTFTDNPRGAVTVKGGAAVQIGTVLGHRGSLLITEQWMGLNTDRRWLDLYHQGMAGVIVRDTSDSAWMAKQGMLDESPAALLQVTNESIAIYDSPPVGRKDLFLLPLIAAGTRSLGLGGQGSDVPVDGTALAAVTDDQLLLVGRPNQVLWYNISSAQTAMGMVPKSLGTVQLPGMPVLAARAEKATKPSQSSMAYFGVAWESGGKATLLQATNVDPVSGLTGGLMAQDPVGGSQSGFTQALAGEQVVAAALGDLDSDGLQDLVVATNTGKILWSWQNADGSFAPPAFLVTQAGTTGLAIGDINGDDLMDLVVTTSDLHVLVYRNQR